jgi:hypothetical protein
MGFVIAGALVLFGVLAALAHVWVAFAACVLVFAVTVGLLVFGHVEDAGITDPSDLDRR